MKGQMTERCGVVEVKERKDWNLEQRKNRKLKPRCSD